MRCLLALLLVAAAARPDRADEARRELTKLFAFLRGEQNEKLAADLERARAAAQAILFDDTRYPVLAKAHKGWRVGIDKQPGQREMEQAVSAAIRLHNRTMQLLAKGLSVKTRTMGLKRPTLEPLEVTRVVNRYGIVVVDAGLTAFLKRYRTRHEAWRKLRRSKGDAFLDAVGALSRGEWSEARSRGGGLSGVEAMAWEALRAAVVLASNERKGAGHDANERDGVRVLNAYRVSLGLAPLILDRRLHYMARDYAVEMTRGRFFSHQHPHDPSRRTPVLRARRAGYLGAVGENASTESNAKRAVWFWRADAGHHRVLVQPFFRAVGMGCAKRAVLNPGNTTEREILGLYGAGDRRKARPVR